MIYGDQSQEGFLQRDYFCCDTNELRLQIHCRPITPEKRLLAYYTQIISEFYPPCYSSEHLILPSLTHIYKCISTSVCGYITALLFRWTAGYCLWCCAVCVGELQLVDLSLLHCVARVSSLSCIFGAPICHLCMCQIAAGPTMKDLWLEGDLANRRPMRKEKMRGERGIKISLYSVIGLF